MSPGEKFDRYMIAHGASKHIKFRRMTTVERYAFFMGVLSLAAQAPARGCLLVGNLRADAEDVAHECDVPVKVAMSALEKLRAIGVVYFDDEAGCERVHDFDDWNPQPRTDLNAGRRMALHRDPALRNLIRERDQDRCRYCNVTVKWQDRRGSEGGTYDHVDPTGPNAEWNLVVACRGCNSRKRDRTPEQAGLSLLQVPGSKSDLDRGVRTEVERSTPEVEVEVEVEELPPSPFAVEFEEWLAHYETTTGHQLPGRATKAFHAIAASYTARRDESYPAEDLKLATVGAHADDYRRENGYDTADSILRPTKIASLVAKGKLRTGGTQRPVTSVQLGERLRGGA